MNINAYCKFIHRFLKCNFFWLFFNDNLSTAAGYPFSGGFSVSLWIVPVCLHDFCRSRVCTVPKRSPIPCARDCRRAGVCIVRPLRAVCMYMKSSRCAMLPPARRIAARPLSAVCCLPGRLPPPAFCRLSGRLTPLAGLRGVRRCLAFLALRYPHCSRLLPLLPAFSRCSRPLPPRAGTPRKSNGAAVVRMRRRWGICLPLFGEFPGSPAGVGLGPQP